MRIVAAHFDIMKKINVSKITGIILIAAGIIVFLSPELIHGFQVAQTQMVVTAYEDKYGRNGGCSTDQEGESGVKEIVSDVRDEDPLYQEIVRYNQSIYMEKQSGFADPWSYEQSPVDLEGFEDGIFGYIEIPSMGQIFAIYIGATMENMSKGVAVMGQTSLPVGGENTNCVIAGHRGYNHNKTFFKYIEDIRIGDMIYITNPWEKLTYRVEAIDVIEPYDIDAVMIQEGRDMVTLLTCHPYASHGQYRYLVYCERCEVNDVMGESAPTAQSESQLEEDKDDKAASDAMIYPSSSVAIKKETAFRRVCAVFIFLFVLIVVMRKGEKKCEI